MKLRISILIAAITTVLSCSAGAPALPDYKAAPYRLLVTDGADRAGSIIYPDVSFHSIEVYGDASKDDLDSVRSLVGVFHDESGAAVYAEWETFTSKPSGRLVRGYSWNGRAWVFGGKTGFLKGAF